MKEPTAQSPGRKKDPSWWMHPAFKGRQALRLSDLNATADGAYKWLSYDSEKSEPDPITEAGMPIGQGKFKEFAQLLFKMNDCKPGPVDNWYVVVCVEQDKRWAVGQLRADPMTPVQLFDDLVFDSEDAARDCAAELKIDSD